MSVTFKLLIFVVQLSVIYSELPPITKCKLSDSACVKNSGQAALPTLVAGVPELGTETLDPMKIDNIKIDLSGLHMNLDDTVIKGLRKAVLEKVVVDPKKKQMSITWVSDILLKGKYQASGRLLILPITGDGDLTLKLKKLQIDLTVNYGVTKNADGKDVIDFKNYKHSFVVRENARFGLTNLFNGNKELSDAMLNFMNENWQAIANEFGTPMLEKPIKKVYESVKTYLKSQPLEDIAEV